MTRAPKLGSLAFRLSHGLKVNAGRESFFMACDCVKCLVLRGLAGGQAYLMKKVSRFFPFLLAIFVRCAIVRACPIHSTSHRRHALARIARVRSSKAVVRPIGSTLSMSRACLSISAFITGSAIAAAVLNGLPGPSLISHWQARAPTWIFTSSTLHNTKKIPR